MEGGARNTWGRSLNVVMAVPLVIGGFHVIHGSTYDKNH